MSALKHMSIFRYFLAFFYAVYAALGLYGFVSGGFNFVRIGVAAFAIITIVALTGKAGNWARLGALLFNVLLLLSGIMLLVFGVWSPDSAGPLPLSLLVTGAVLAAMAGLTLWTLLRASQKAVGTVS